MNIQVKWLKLEKKIIEKKNLRKLAETFLL